MTPTAKNQPALPDPDDKPEAIEVAEVLPPEGQITPGTGLAPHTGDLVPKDEWSDIDAGDVSPNPRSIPFMESNRKANGGFVDDQGDTVQELNFVWLAKGRSRAFWEKKMGEPGATRRPTCRSNDAIVPDPASPQVQAKECAGCEHSQWGPNSEPPACKESIEALAFVQKAQPGGGGRLSRLRFGGLAYAPAAAYWNSFDRDLPYRPPLAYLTNVKLIPTEVAHDRGTFLVPKFTSVEEFTLAQVRPLIEQRDKRKADWQRDIAADMAEGVGVDTNGDGDKGDPFAEAKEKYGPDGDPSLYAAEPPPDEDMGREF